MLCYSKGTDNNEAYSRARMWSLVSVLTSRSRDVLLVSVSAQKVSTSEWRDATVSSHLVGAVNWALSQLSHHAKLRHMFRCSPWMVWTLGNGKWMKVVIKWLMSLKLFTTTMPSKNRKKLVSANVDDERRWWEKNWWRRLHVSDIIY